ncbi:MAG: hypothetical protein E6565_11505 [Staphylococcus epidermidis]|jgi:hypothetical protein|nr:hypothetical protein [Staphylococcus epidermidis]
MEHTKGTMIVSAVLLVVCLAIASFLIFHEQQIFPSLIFLGLAFIDDTKFYLSYQKLKERDHHGNN